VVGANNLPLSNCTLREAYSELVLSHPYREALVVHTTGRRVTFATLGEDADIVARMLGLHYGQLLANWLSNCEAWVVLLLACARRGVVVVALGLEYRAPELLHALRLSGADILVNYPVAVVCRCTLSRLLSLFARDVGSQTLS